MYDGYELRVSHRSEVMSLESFYLILNGQQHVGPYILPCSSVYSRLVHRLSTLHYRKAIQIMRFVKQAFSAIISHLASNVLICGLILGSQHLQVDHNCRDLSHETLHLRSALQKPRNNILSSTHPTLSHCPSQRYILVLVSQFRLQFSRRILRETLKLYQSS